MNSGKKDKEIHEEYMTSMTGLAEFHLQQLMKKGKVETTFGRLKNKNSSPPTTYRSLGQLAKGVKFS